MGAAFTIKLLECNLQVAYYYQNLFFFVATFRDWNIRKVFFLSKKITHKQRTHGNTIVPKNTHCGSLYQSTLFYYVSFNHRLWTHKDQIPNSLWPKFKFKFKSQSQSQSQINIWDVNIKAYFFCRNNGWIMENMDKGLTVPK